MKLDLEDIQKTVDDVADIVNCFDDGPMNSFIRQMTFKHRTLQQSFTRLCLKWIETVGCDQYPYDGRNQISHEVCKNIVETMKPINNGCELSKTLPLI